MAKVFRNGLVVFLVGMLFFPTIVRLGHHHEHVECHAKAEKHFHEHHEKCPVCSFEFSVFISKTFFSLPKMVVLYGVYTNNNNESNLSTTPDYTFLLRAPPAFNC